METTVTGEMMRTDGERVELFDERGRLIGVIRRPVERDPVGPGRETVYLSRTRTPRVQGARAA